MGEEPAPYLIRGARKAGERTGKIMEGMEGIEGKRLTYYRRISEATNA